MSTEPLAAGRIRTLLSENPGTELRALELLTRPGDLGLEWGGLDPQGDRAGVRVYQRLSALHPDLDVAERLARRGLVSANHVARMPRAAFVDEHAAALGLDPGEAAELHARATGVRSRTLHLWASVGGTVSSAFVRGSAADTVSAELGETFENLPSYQDLFGTLDDCGCEECRSIFGPAAYLVDLLRIIDEHVTRPNAASIDPELLFSARRPDIGAIPLDCAHTTTLVPYLQIVNERLGARAAAALGVDGAAAVQERMANGLVYPRPLPFNTQLDQVLVLLDRVGVRFDAVLAAWASPPATVAARGLGLSPEAQAIVTTPLATADAVAPFYGVAAGQTGTLADADVFLAKTGSTFADLLALLDQDLSPAERAAGLRANFFINGGLGGSWVGLAQPDDGAATLTNLDVDPLDRINRLLRLADAVGRTPAEVDWALRCVRRGGPPAVDDDALVSLYALIGLAGRLSLELAAAAALLGPVKSYGEGADGAGSAFDRLFNPPALAARQGVYHPAGNPLNPGYADAPLAWTPGSTAAADVAAITRVLPGLGLSVSDAGALGTLLYGTAPRTLTVEVLSALYRHALLSRALSLPMSRYRVLLGVMGPADPAAPTLDELGALATTARWLAGAGLSVFQLDYAVNGTASVYVDPLYRPGSVDAWLRGLAGSVSAASPTLDTDLAAQVAVLFGAATSTAAAVLPMAVAAVPLPAGAATWEEGFLAVAADGATPAYEPYAQGVLAWVSRWLVPAQALGLADATLASAAAHPAAYGLPAGFAALPVAAVQNLAGVQSLMRAHGDLRQNLLAYVDLASSAGPPADPLAALQDATGWDPGAVEQLLAGPAAGETVLAARLARLERCFALMRALGADPTLMGTIAALGGAPATSWAQYTQTAAAVLAATSARYGEEWSGVWATLSGTLAVHERDALLALVLAQLNAEHPGIRDARNVYEFLLTDVQMGAATQVSYVLEALNAAQLYLQRCRLRLEPGVLDLGQIQDAWWEWMMSYRVWEANREIFVYPENYLVPDLRGSATPQFGALAQALQQSQVTRAYVGSAFKSYIDGFAEVAQLTPVDACRTRVHDADTLYLLARSRTAPYAFYYCSQAEGMPWTPWQKIDLAIGSASCTLAYAFSRPFLFWNEIKRSSNSVVAGSAGTVSTTSGASYTATVMYSFLDQAGKWVQPQTLVADEVVSFESDDGRDVALRQSEVFAGLFDMDDPVWTRVYAFAVDAANYASPPGSPAGAERLVVMYGPDVLNTGTPVDAGATPPTADPAATAFWWNLHDRARDHDRMVRAQLSGNLPLRPVAVLNLALDRDVLVRRGELVLLDPYQANTPLSQVRAEMQSSGSVLQLTHAAQAVSENRAPAVRASLTAEGAATSLDGNSFVGGGVSPQQSAAIFTALADAGVLDANGDVQASRMPTLDLYSVLAGLAAYGAFGPAQFATVQKELLDHMGAAALFDSVDGTNSSVAPVRSQPGWFLFSTAGEVFLLSPRPAASGNPVFSTFADGITLAPPAVTPLSAIMRYGGATPGSIDAAASAQVYATLVLHNLIHDGQLSPKATLEVLGLVFGNLVLQNTITDDQVPYIQLALRNAPMVFPDAFVGGAIDEPTSATIYATLQLYSIVDPNGRIGAERLTGSNVALALGNLLLNGTLTRGQIASVYTTLAQAPAPVALGYANRGDTTGLDTTDAFVFDVTRLSTGAVSRLSRALFAGGVDLLLDPATQDIPVVPVLPFDRFGPSPTSLAWPSALDATQVDFDGLYGQYYWEIFYHVPLLVAYALNANQQFADAQAWLQYVFDPTRAERFVTADVLAAQTAEAISPQQAAGIVAQLGAHTAGTPAAPILSAAGEVGPGFTATTDLGFLQAADPSLTDDQMRMTRNVLLNYQLNAPASHFWNFRPFRNHTLASLAEMLAGGSTAVRVYNDDPFDPFAIARLRIGAFEKSTLMQYVDNLIAWGDQLFTQDSWESITAAYMLYVYTHDLLGPKPEQVGDCAGDGATLSFDEIRAQYPDGIPQFLIDLEDFVPAGGGPDVPTTGHAFNDLYVYFCVPENARLVSRWDTIQDRMYKIDHSMNIEGVVRTLALFQPPLDPMELARAAAAGNDVPGAATAGQALAPYRYAAAISTAQSLCAVVVDLGNALLTALEKGDAERLATLRNTQEGQILDMVTQVKQARITELQATLQSLAAVQAGASNRLAFYGDLIGGGLSSYENTSLSAADAALAFSMLGSISKTAATIAYTIPQVGSPFAMTYGGIQVGSSLSAASAVLEIGSEISNFISQRALTMGGYERRSQEWGMQQKNARSELDAVTEQLASASAQLQAAQQELAAHLRGIAQNAAIESYLAEKFTSQALYLWMAGRLSAVYRQSYALALQAARQAETAFQFELDSGQSFLTSDFWDGAHNGLLAGEGLRLALTRLDAAYRGGSTRRLEVERTLSLAMIAPDQLLALRTTGACAFSLTESLFDYDYPGHYARKLRSVSVSIPATVGPYQNVKATLTQTRNSVVTAPSLDAVKYLLGLSQDPPAAGLRTGWAPSQCVAISRGVDDSGLFVLDFQDARYLPFENTGAVSDWTLQLPLETNRFDVEQLSDVLLTVRYTALHDGGLEAGVKEALGEAPLGGGVFVDGALQGAAWQAFLADHTDPARQTLTLAVDPVQLGYFRALTWTTVMVRLEVADGVALADGATFLTLTAGDQPAQTPALSGGRGEADGLGWNGKTLPRSWSFAFDLAAPDAAPLLSGGFIDPGKLLDVQVIALYQAKVF
ncbi:MAG TPA: neuraminidase-like domain-containing protein [Longimicrobium sp.]|nr:neuraminidase-like domain-containing protein [Longimicrobium sp.]